MVAWHEESFSEMQITKGLQFSKGSVHQATEKFKKHMSYRDMKKTGKFRKTSRRDDHPIRQAIVQSPTSFCRKLRANIGLLKNIQTLVLVRFHVVRARSLV